jgi:chitin disaccharide deacetylase
VKYLITNADDFGLSQGVNEGIIRAHEHGILTSTSLMVRWPGARAAAAYAREHPRFSVGLHLDFAEWICVNYEWKPLYQVVSTEDPVALKAEAWRQLENFRQIVGKDPTHIDSHQHQHINEPARTIITEMARQCGAPLRKITPDIAYCGDFYGQTGEGLPYPQGITLECYLGIIAKTPEGFTEAACHVGNDPQLDSVYKTERMQELAVICDPRLREAARKHGVQFCSFLDYTRMKAGF